MGIILILVAFVSGLLTVLAPCSLPLLPVVIGGSLSDSKNRLKPYIIVFSLAISIIIFTLLIRVSTIFLDVPASFWTTAAGVILIILSITMIFPLAWARFTTKIGLEIGANRWMSKAHGRGGVTGDILLGAALGPVFTSCSPTYFIVLAAVLPQSLANGILLLTVYVLGIVAILLPIALIGQSLVKRLQFLANPNGWFKKSMGVLILIVGLMIITGFEHKLEAYLIEKGFNFSEFENRLLEKADIDTTTEIDL